MRFLMKHVHPAASEEEHDMQEVFSLPSWAVQGGGVQPNNPLSFGGVFTVGCPAWAIRMT